MKITSAALRFPALAAICLLMLATACCAPKAMTQDDFKKALKKALDEDPALVMDVLRDNSIDVYNIGAKGQSLRRVREKARRLAAELADPKKPKIDESRAILGPSDAPAIIVEYSDFLCGYCARAAMTIKELMRKNPKDVRLIFKHLPHTEPSRDAALYFEALARQDAALAWAFHDLAFENQADIYEKGREALTELARQTGADMTRLDTDLKDKALLDLIQTDAAEAASFGFTGTPMFLVNGVSVLGAQPYSEFDQTLRLVLERDKTK